VEEYLVSQQPLQDQPTLLPCILYVLADLQMVHKKYTSSGLNKYVAICNDQTSIGVQLCDPSIVYTLFSHPYTIQ
jgi:hypothetical protein